MDIITHGDKAYAVEGDRVIAAADSPELLEPTEKTASVEPVEAVPFRRNDRVEVSGRAGRISALITTVYGDTASVEFDDGHVESFFLEKLTHSEVEQPSFATPIEEIISEFEVYESFYAAGIPEIQKKAKKARELNLRAKALISGAETQDKIRLDKIVVTTSVDLQSLRDDEQKLTASEEGYLESLPKYEVQGGPSGHDHGTEDASWIVDAAAAQDEELSAINWDGFLASEAVSLVARVNESVVSDEAMLDETATDYFQFLAHGLDEGNYKVRLAQFKGFIRTSRTEKVEKIAAREEVEKTASAEDDTPFESLFI